MRCGAECAAAASSCTVTNTFAAAPRLSAHRQRPAAAAGCLQVARVVGVLAAGQKTAEELLDRCGWHLAGSGRLEPLAGEVDKLVRRLQALPSAASAQVPTWLLLRGAAGPPVLGMVPHSEGAALMSSRVGGCAALPATLAADSSFLPLARGWRSLKVLWHDRESVC